MKDKKNLMTTDKTQIMKALDVWLRNQNNATFFTTCYKARAVGVFVQYELPDKNSDPYLYAVDQGIDDVLGYISGWLHAIFQKDVMFKVEEREKVGFSIFISLDRKEDIEINEDDVEIPAQPQPQPQPVKEDKVLKESEQRSMEEIVVVATSNPISRSMENKDDDQSVQGIKRSMPSIKVQSNVRVENIDIKGSKDNEKKQVGRKAEYNWIKLPELYEKYKGSVTKIAKDLGCSGPAVRRQIVKLKLK